MKAPAFQFYPSDYIGSQRVRLMTLEEEGAYINLLCSCWQHGSIPADPDLAARIIGKGASTTLATTVLTMFAPSVEPGRLVHERLEHERGKQEAWRNKSAAGGRKSAEMRKGGSTTVARVVQPKGNSSSSSSSSSSINTEVALLKVRVGSLFGRTEKRTWTVAEERALKSAKVVLAEATEEEWALIEWWYSLPTTSAPYRKTDLAALLNNWHAEIEKAKRNKNVTEDELPRLGVNIK